MAAVKAYQCADCEAVYDYIQDAMSCCRGYIASRYECLDCGKLIDSFVEAVNCHPEIADVVEL